MFASDGKGSRSRVRVREKVIPSRILAVVAHLPRSRQRPTDEFRESAYPHDPARASRIRRRHLPDTHVHAPCVTHALWCSCASRTASLAVPPRAASWARAVTIGASPTTHANTPHMHVRNRGGHLWRRLAFGVRRSGIQTAPTRLRRRPPEHSKRTHWCACKTPCTQPS